MVICAIRNALRAASFFADIATAEEHVSNVSLIRGDTERQAAAQRKGSASPVGSHRTNIPASDIEMDLLAQEVEAATESAWLG